MHTQQVIDFISFQSQSFIDSLRAQPWSQDKRAHGEYVGKEGPFHHGSFEDLVVRQHVNVIRSQGS